MWEVEGGVWSSLTRRHLSDRLGSETISVSQDFVRTEQHVLAAAVWENCTLQQQGAVFK